MAHGFNGMNVKSCAILFVGGLVMSINSTKENSIRFWKFIGFTPNGKDEYDIPLFIKKAGLY